MKQVGNKIRLVILIEMDAVVKKKIRPKEGPILILQNSKKTTVVAQWQPLCQEGNRCVNKARMLPSKLSFQSYGQEQVI